MSRPTVVIPELGKVEVDQTTMDELRAMVRVAPGEPDLATFEGVLHPATARLIAERVMYPPVTAKQVEGLRRGMARAGV